MSPRRLSLSYISPIILIITCLCSFSSGLVFVSSQYLCTSRCSIITMFAQWLVIGWFDDDSLLAVKASILNTQLKVLLLASLSNRCHVIVNDIMSYKWGSSVIGKCNQSGFKEFKFLTKRSFFCCLSDFLSHLNYFLKCNLKVSSS